MIDQTPSIPNLNGFPSLLDNGNEDFDFDYEEKNDYDADEDDGDAFNASSDEECKNFLYNHEYCNNSLSTADCLMTNKS